MLYSIRSTINNKVDFKKGDKFVTANVINNDTIEYIINRPVYSYCIRSIKMNKFIKVQTKDKAPSFVAVASDATYFKSYKAANDYIDREVGQENASNLMLDIMESVE